MLIEKISLIREEDTDVSRFNGNPNAQLTLRQFIKMTSIQQNVCGEMELKGESMWMQVGFEIDAKILHNMHFL